MAIDERIMRDALGQFVTGVTVITAMPKGGVPIGLTVNSFASVSLDPPLILWSIQKNSETLDVFECTDNFVVNVLPGDAQALSNRYAMPENHNLEIDHLSLSDTGLPLLKQAKVSFECTTEQRIAGGDHTIYLARVTALSAIDPAEPLVFYNGGYRKLNL